MMSETDRIEYKQHLITDIAKFGIAQLGFGIPKVLQFYGRDCFELSDNFLRMKFQALDVTPHDTPHVIPQVLELLEVMKNELKRSEIQRLLNMKDRKNFVDKYVNPALEMGVIEYTKPDKPTSSSQKYRITKLGEAVREQNS